MKAALEKIKNFLILIERKTVEYICYETFCIKSHINTHIHTHTYTHTHIDVHKQMCVHIYVHICVCMRKKFSLST